MKKQNFEPKAHWDWEDEETLEELILNLNEVKTQLEGRDHSSHDIPSAWEGENLEHD